MVANVYSLMEQEAESTHRFINKVQKRITVNNLHDYKFFFIMFETAFMGI